MSNESEQYGNEGAIKVYDEMHPEEEFGRKVEMVRVGIQGQFWLWIKELLERDIARDVLLLSDPGCTDDIQFLRGKIRARNELLMLPKQLVESYDVDRELDGADNPPSGREDTPLTRRGSPTPKGDD